MIIMGNTIMGATSGEPADQAAPKDSQSQAKGQKNNVRIQCYSVLFWRLENSNLFYCTDISLKYLLNMRELEEVKKHTEWSFIY